ncbi:hypothetical protein N0V91_006494 [Didymella pomorum]|uniref:Heterokaryon incompatibility domain-containing protein n=1 Tax=Didymella pomorum TaxID=749634 RepID=A0A9W8ZAR5_9PLEO|nr:hypothetical protein N0V91_006494 [Didymella pomorum]
MAESALMSTAGEEADYICLSHCWGLAQIITTTKATLNERKRGIPWGLLSNTFQDAIVMTRTLGFRYIWIDSLCIVQDDALDWEKESAQMASVYSNGYLTLAGTRSRKGNGGLFSKKHDVEVSGTTPNGHSYCIHFRERIDDRIEMIPDSTNEHYPLLTRAWVYQERILSTRVLHFGHFELFFECHSSIQCECGYVSYEEDDPGIEKSLVKIEFADALSQLSLPGAQEVDANTAYYAARMWRTIVSSYSALSLTKAADRLPALGGLARQTAAARGTTYYAGLWKDRSTMIFSGPPIAKQEPSLQHRGRAQEQLLHGRGQAHQDTSIITTRLSSPALMKGLSIHKSRIGTSQ